MRRQHDELRKQWSPMFEDQSWYTVGKSQCRLSSDRAYKLVVAEIDGVVEAAVYHGDKLVAKYARS